MTVSERLVILDRDGVVNLDSDSYIKGPDEWIPIPGSIEAIARLSQAGYRVALATNQSGIGRGFFDLSQLNQMHRKMRELLAKLGAQIDVIAFCPHRPSDTCACRKPQPGLLLSLAARLDVSPLGVPFIGDSISDVRAARAAGMEPWLVLSGKGAATLSNYRSELEGVFICEDLSEAVRRLLGPRGQE